MLVKYFKYLGLPLRFYVITLCLHTVSFCFKLWLHDWEIILLFFVLNNFISVIAKVINRYTPLKVINYVEQLDFERAYTLQIFFIRHRPTLEGKLAQIKYLAGNMPV